MNTQEIVPGTLVHGRYSVRVRIGEGGGGIVYRAFDTSLESWVILKQIKDSTIAPDERRTEVNVLKELRHQRIPKVLDYFNYEGHVYTVMDFIDGRDLGVMLREYHQFDENRVLQWAGQLADVLAYIHSRKTPIVHSDVKPSNIMVDQIDELTLIDFNISRIFRNERKDVSWISAGYSSPEQFGDISLYERFRKERLEKGNPVFYTEKPSAEVFSKEIDPRTDVYSFGATLYHLLTGIRPDPLYECVCPLSKTGVRVSAGFAEIIERCMRVDRDLRYRNGREILNALNALNSRGRPVSSGNEKNFTQTFSDSVRQNKPVRPNAAGPDRSPDDRGGTAADSGGSRRYTRGPGYDPDMTAGPIPGDHTEHILPGKGSDAGNREYPGQTDRRNPAFPGGTDQHGGSNPYDPMKTGFGPSNREPRIPAGRAEKRCREQRENRLDDRHGRSQKKTENCRDPYGTCSRFSLCHHFPGCCDHEDRGISMVLGFGRERQQLL